MSSKRNLVVRVQIGSYLAVFTNNIQSGQTLRKYVHINFLEDPNTKKLFEQMNSFVNFKNVKAMVLDCKPFPTFEDGYTLRQEFAEICKKHGIFYSYLPSNLAYESFAVFYHTKTMVKEGVKVLIIFSFMPMFPDGASFVREKNCYRMIDGHKTRKQMLTPQWKRDFMGECKPKKVIVLQMWDTATRAFMECFKEFDPIVLTLDDECSLYNEAMVPMVLHHMGEKLSEYNVALQSETEMHICVGYKNIVKVTRETVLPFEKDVIVDVKPTKTISLHVTYGASPSHVIQRIKMSDFNTKKIKITFKLDINSFYEFKAEPFDEEKETEASKDTVNDPSAQSASSSSLDNLNGDMAKLNTTSDKTATEKIRMVFSKQTFSVYDFVDEKEFVIKGACDIPIYIAFNEKAPIFGKDAMEVFNKKPEFVVFDLIKLCSTTNPNIMRPKWGFRVSKKNDLMMVTVETDEGERQSSTDFLLSLILKDAIKYAGKKNGENIDELEIGFNDFVGNENLKEAFEKAGKTLNLKITFC